MTTTSLAIFTIALVGLIYLVLWKQSKFLAGVMFLLSGLGIMYLEQSNAWVGFILLSIGLYSMFSLIIPNKRKK